MTSPKRRWSSASGIILVVIGAIMMQCAAATFVSTDEPGQLLEAIGAISFFTWWIPVALGLFLLIFDRFSHR